MSRDAALMTLAIFFGIALAAPAVAQTADIPPSLITNQEKIVLLTAELAGVE